MLRHHSMWLLVAFLGTGFGQSDAKKVARTSGARSHSDDDAAIKQVAAQYVEYWNRHEFERTAELRTADSENVNVVGQRSTRADITKGGPSYYQQAFGNSTIHDTVVSIKYLKPDVAAVDVAWEMTGAKCPDGSDAVVSSRAEEPGHDEGSWQVADRGFPQHGLAHTGRPERAAYRSLPIPVKPTWLRSILSCRPGSENRRK